MKRSYLFVVVIITLCFPHGALAKISELVIAGPRSCVVHPLIYMKEAGLLDQAAETVKLIIWNNPDQLRALMAGGQVHFSAVPSYVAANFYNKGLELKLLNISTWGLLWLVSSDPDVKALADLKNETITLTYKRDLPDLVFTNLAKAQGLDPQTDFNLKYLPDFKAVAQELLSGRTRHAMLAEPIASITVLKSSKQGTSKVYRAVDIQAEWQKIHQTKRGMPEAGICALPSIMGQPHIVTAFQKAYETAINFCKTHPEAAAGIVAQYLQKTNPAPIAAALKNARLEFVTAQDARPELTEFYNVLMALNPEKTGGRLPGDGFYWKDR